MSSAAAAIVNSAFSPGEHADRRIGVARNRAGGTAHREQNVQFWITTDITTK
jgi:hypothetical protein